MNEPRSSIRLRAGRPVDAVVIGAGQSGLAMSRCLAENGIDHVVLERGEVANSWRRERWDSLRLLTPNWQSRLPGYAYAGDDPNGFMTMPEVIDFIEDYARLTAAPVRNHTCVESVREDGRRYRVTTNRGTWLAPAVVLANGAFATPSVPAVDSDLPGWLHRITSQQYRNPGQLADGRVLIVGASATGVQLAKEIHDSGRAVTLAVGEHIRMPRNYRGLDIQWWLSESGVLDQQYTEVEDIQRARRVPSPQLVGSDDHQSLDLNVLGDAGVELVGRLVGVRDNTAQFSGSLANHCAMADLKLGRLLDTFDEWATGTGVSSVQEPPSRPEPTRVPARPRLGIDLQREKFETVIWATGLKPDYAWLELATLDRKGQIIHDGGIAQAPGVYVMGLPFMRRRKSSYMHGTEDDARDLSAHLVRYLHAEASPRARRLAIG